jgi:hypothetical protein
MRPTLGCGVAYMVDHMVDTSRPRGRVDTHARLLLGSPGRRFFELAKDGNAPIASEALERIAGLYSIEKAIRGHGADARRAVRQERSKPPLVLALKACLEQQLARVSARAVIAEDIRYALHHWDACPFPR